MQELIAHGGIQLLLQGGHHPRLKSDWFAELFGDIKKRYPQIWIHGMSPPEIHHLSRLEKRPVLEVLKDLKAAGLDSIPAVFGISRDPFIVFTSNVCAVLGLRAMFFLLENVIDRFHYLPYGLGLVLAFIGVKMVLAEGLGGAGLYALGVPSHPVLDPYHVPIGPSLLFVAAVLVISVVASLMIPASED